MWARLCLAWIVLCGSVSAQNDRWQLLGPERELADLIDTWSSLAGVSVEYSRPEVAGTLSLRTTNPVSLPELAALIHRALAAKNLTTIQAPGSTHLEVVSLEKAASLARLEPGSIADAQAGYVRVVITLERERADQVLEGVRAVLSKAGSAQLFSEARRILVADLTPHVRQALELARQLDGHAQSLTILEIPLQASLAVELSALVEKILIARKALRQASLEGSLIPHPSRNRVIVVAPPSEHDTWRALIAELDRGEQVRTRPYVPHRFGLRDTARMLTELVRPSPSDPHWRMVIDELSGSLVISASPAQHQAVEEWLLRWEATDRDPPRPLRSFEIRHRSVGELLELLLGMLESAPTLEGTDPSGRVVDRLPSETRVPIEGATAPISAAVSPSSADRRITSRRAGTDQLALTADVATNRLLALGTPQQLEQLERLIRDLDQREPQVLIEATALSMSESDARALGVELQKVGTKDQTLYSLGSLFGLGGVGPLDPSLPALQSSGGSALVLDPGSYSLLVRALESVQDGRSLASPKLLVSNYQTAELYSVLQTPFQSTNASSTVATTSFGGTQDAGTQIQVTPRITQGEELLLEYSISVSSFVGESADPALPPPRQETKLKSSANIPDGFAIILGGLEIETLGKARSAVPVLGSIPLLGELFASQTRSMEKSRFYVFLKVSILRSSSFEDLRQISETQALESGLDPTWPRLEPRMIR